MGKPINVRCSAAHGVFSTKMAKRGRNGFTPSKSNHYLFVLHLNGRKKNIRAKFSFGSKEYVHSRVPNQLKISTRFFLDIIKCPKDLRDYIVELRNRGIS